MDKIQVLNITAVINNMFNFLYTKSAKKYFVNINWFDNNTNISIKEQFEKEKILDIDIQGNIETYNLIVKNIIKSVINNPNTFGYLTTTCNGNDRRLDCQQIRTNNLEINLPIYTTVGLIQAENINNMLISNMNESPINDDVKIQVLSKS